MTYQEYQADDYVCAYYLEDVQVGQMRPLDWCGAYEDEACCQGKDFSCPLRCRKTTRMRFPTAIDILGAVLGYKK
jgi:hypothetical protein